MRDGQSKMLENMGAMSPLSGMPGFEAMQAQQEAFLKAMTSGFSTRPDDPPKPEPFAADPSDTSDLQTIKSQLADLQAQLEKLSR